MRYFGVKRTRQIVARSKHGSRARNHQTRHTIILPQRLERSDSIGVLLGGEGVHLVGANELEEGDATDMGHCQR